MGLDSFVNSALITTVILKPGLTRQLGWVEVVPQTEEASVPVFLQFMQLGKEKQSSP